MKAQIAATKRDDRCIGVLRRIEKKLPPFPRKRLSNLACALDEELRQRTQASILECDDPGLSARRRQFDGQHSDRGAIMKSKRGGGSDRQKAPGFHEFDSHIDRITVDGRARRRETLRAKGLQTNRPVRGNRPTASLKRDELSLNRLSIPFVPAEAGTQFFGRVLGPWVPAFAGTNGDWFSGGANLKSSHSRRRVAIQADRA